MAEIPGEINNTNLNDLRESIDYSRQLIDNAKILYDLNKRSSSELFRGFKESSKTLLKNLEDLKGNYKKYLGYESDHKAVLKKVEEIERTRNELIEKGNKLEQIALKEDQAKIDSLSNQAKILKKQLDTGAKINSTLYDQKRTLHNEKLKELKTALKENEVLVTTLNLTKEMTDDVEKQLIVLKEHAGILGKVQGKIDLVRRLYESIAKIPILGAFVNTQKGVETFLKL